MVAKERKKEEKKMKENEIYEGNGNVKAEILKVKKSMKMKVMWKKRNGERES